MEFDFAAMLDKHRAARHRAGMLAVALAAIGLSIALAAWRWLPGDIVMVWFGLLVAALGAVPLGFAIDRRDRLSGLEELRGHWAQAGAIRDRAGRGHVDRLRRLIQTVHGVAR